MAPDELTTYLNNLQRDECYRIDALLKEERYETTQRVSLLGANGSVQGSYVRKYISVESGLGAVYELLFNAWKMGERFRHIPVIHDCYHIETDIVVIMEDVMGDTLQDIILQYGSSHALVCDLFPRICDAVIELHTGFPSPIIHRDLKPSNIMVSSHGLTLIDFGIARIHKEEAEYDTAYFGTKSYAPPEQFGFGQTDIRSDVYSLGMLLYYCLAEKTPTAKDRDQGFADPCISHSFQSVIKRASHLDPEKRYSDVQELKTAFFEAAQTLPLADSSKQNYLKGQHYAQRQQYEQSEGAHFPTQKPRRSVLQAIPRGLGIAWNIVLALILLLFVAAAFSMAIDPPPETLETPFFARLILYEAISLLIIGPLCFLLLDKRFFAARFPSIAHMKFLKQIVVVLVCFALGFLLVGFVTLVY